MFSNRLPLKRFERQPRLYITCSSSHHNYIMAAERVEEQNNEIVTWRNVDQVKKYLMKELECSPKLLQALLENELISKDDWHTISGRQNRPERVALFNEKVINNLTYRKKQLLYTVLKENECGNVADNIKDIEVNAKYVSPENINLGKNIAVIKMESDAEDIPRVINLQNPNAISSSIPQLGFSVVNTQPGCVEIFIYSTTKPVYTAISKEIFCKKMMEQLFCLETVGKKVEVGQKIRLVVKRNPYDSSLLDDQDKKIASFTTSDVISINRTFIIRNIKNVNKLYQKLQTELSQNETFSNGISLEDKILILLKNCEDKEWEDVISCLKESDNEEIVTRLKQTSCIECYRSTVLSNIEDVLDEITTDMMEKTFDGHSYIPEVITDACIKSKGKTSRVIRAKSFLEYVLIKGSVVVSFAKVFASSTTSALEFSPCKEHSCCKSDKLITDSEEVTFNFVVFKDETGKYCLREDNDDTIAKQSKESDYHEHDVEISPSEQLAEKAFKQAQKYVLENGKISGMENKIPQNGVIEKICSG